MSKIDLSSAKTEKNRLSALILLAICLVIIIYLAFTFKSMWTPDTFYPGPGVTRQTMLSEWYPELAGTAGDTPVYILQGAEPGGTILVMGGTHANEPAGVLAATYLLENAQPKQGTLIVIPETNASGFTCTDPQEAAPMFYSIDTPAGGRTFRYGSRATNPIYQWPDPDIYVHASSGQKLSGSETRNLNRTYPGRTDGTFTEKISYAVTSLIKAEGVDITVDLHEASPEYPNINSVVAHENAVLMASMAAIDLELDGMKIIVENSPQNLHGLTHRELGDYTDTMALLMETSNPAQGRLRGATSEELVVTGQDKYYVKAGEYGRLYVEFTDEGHPISERVARHITGVVAFTRSFTDMCMGEPIDLGDIASYDELRANLGSYLAPKTAATVVETSVEATAPETQAFVAAPVTAVAKKDSEEPSGAVTTAELDDMERDPSYFYDIESMLPSDFGAFFTTEYSCETETYSLLSGSYFENEVTVIHGAKDGPSVYIVAGVHGDEEAAWRVGNLLKKISIESGTLYILSPANRWGAADTPRTRYLDGKDLNRVFPGNPGGSNAQKVANAIFTDIQDKKPDFVFDLHEATVIEPGRDYLGSSLIFTDMDLFDGLFLDLILATENGEICSRRFDYYSPGPEGSINRTVSEQLKIPVITVETFRGYRMEERVSDQLDVIQYVLKYYEMV